MPTLSKTWRFDIGRVNPQANVSATACMQYFLWYIKAFLTGGIGGATQGLWSVSQSCDGTAYGTPGDNVDRWTDYTKVVVASGAVSHSWCVVKSPTLADGRVLYLTIVAQATTTNNTGSTPSSCQLYCSRTAPTGGNATTTPTIPTDAFPVPQGQTYGTLDGENVTAARHLCAGLTTDGSVFYFVQSKDGDGFARTVIIFAVLTNTKVNDQYPYWLYQYYDAATPGGAAAVDLQAVHAANAGAGRTWNGASAMNSLMVMPYIGGSIATLTGVVNAVDPADNSYFDFPCWVGFLNSSSSSLIAGGSQFKGTVPDFAIGPTQCPQGSTDAAPGSVTSMLLGNLWFPSNAAPTL